MKILTAITTIFYSMMGLANKVYAQSEWGDNELAGVNLGTSSLDDIITNIINIVLSFLGIIAIVIILYAGYLWMTSAGNAERIQKAKLALISGFIGLVIIVSAWAIANYLLEEFGKATGFITPGGGTTPPGGGINCTCDGSFKICGITPMVRGVGQTISIIGCSMGTDGTVGFEPVGGGPIVSAEPLSCNGDFSWKPNKIRVKVPAVDFGDYKVIITPDGAASGFTFPDDVVPSTGTHFFVAPDSDGPDINCTVPDPFEGPEGATMELQGSGFGTVTSLPEPVLVFESTGIEISASAIDAGAGSWDENVIRFEIPVGTMSGNIRVRLDGAPNPESNPEWLDVTCATAADCDGGGPTSCCTAAGYCRQFDPYCLDDSGPRITNITPGDAGDLDIITIQGYNFGDVPGTVEFFDGTRTLQGVIPSTINAACTAPYWFDNYIIIGVPAAPLDFGSIQVEVITNAGIPSNQYGWEKANVDRPGICGISSPDGQFGDLETLYGVGFATGNATVLYGGIPDNIESNCTATSCSTRVPNLLGSNILLQVQNNDANSYISNPYPYTVLENITGIPIISELSPDAGPFRQYVTIKGSNFGGSRGSVEFALPDGSATTTALSNFPAQCNDGVWSNNQIITIVPFLGNVPLTDIEVVVTRAGDGATNDVAEPDNNFYYNPVLDPTPGLCAIVPNNGPQGYTPPNFINLYGDNFDDGLGGDNVEFSSGEIADINPGGWDLQQIEVLAVPDAAISGDVVVNVNGALRSNPLTFTVGECQTDPDNCSVSGQSCCPTPGGNICLPSAQCDYGPKECEYTWHIETVADPFGPQLNFCEKGPTPWPDGWVDPDGNPSGNIESKDVYERTNLSVQFNRNIFNEDLLNEDNFRVYKCNLDPTATGFIPGDCNIATAVPIPGNSSVLNNGSDSEGILFSPVGNLEKDYWYAVVLGDSNVPGSFKGFRDQNGGDVWKYGDGPDAFRNLNWHFRVRGDGKSCEVATVDVSPVEPTSNFMFGGQRSFTALPMSDQCTICAGQFNWQYWKEDSFINDNSPHFDLVTSTNPRNFGKMTIDSDASDPNHLPTDSLLTASPNAVVWAAVPGTTTPTSLIQGQGSAVIESPQFKWISRTPDDCSDACVGSQVRITFSTPIDLADINNTNFRIPPLVTVRPEAFNLTADGSAARGVIINGNGIDGTGPNSDSFLPLTTYNVRIDAALRDIYGNSLTNWADDWDFATGEAGACFVDSTQIFPQDITVPIGRTTDYYTVAYSQPGICYPAGQAISCNASTGCNWDPFTSSPAGNDVAIVTNSNTGLVYASSSPPAPDNTVVIGRNANISSGVLSANTTITVQPGPPPPVYPNPNIILPSRMPTPGGSNICMGSLAHVEFDIPMNTASVRDNFHVYLMSNAPVSGYDCIEVANAPTALGLPDASLTWMCRNTSEVTQVVNSREFLIKPNYNSNSVYIAGVFSDTSNLGSGVLSQNGISLEDGTFNNFADLDGDTNTDGHFWWFEVGEDACIPNRMTIMRQHTSSTGQYVFTCAQNDCAEDEGALSRNGERQGNQISFRAMGYDIIGNMIAITPADVTWTVMNGLLADLEWTPIPTDTYSSIDVWPAPITNPENGQDFLHVEYPYTLPNGITGTLEDVLPININICEVPWPDPATTGDYYWEDTVETSPSKVETNFSTRYCQFTGNPGDTFLPKIPWATSNGPKDLSITLADGILRDYLLIVDTSTTTASTLPQNNPSNGLFGSLAFKGEKLDNGSDSGNFFKAKLSKLKNGLLGNSETNAQGIPLPPPGTCPCLADGELALVPNTLRASVTGGTNVDLTWDFNYCDQFQYFRIRRAELPNAAVDLGTSVNPQFSSVIEEGKVYDYYVQAKSSNCARTSADSAARRVGNTGIVDAIGVRVMANPDGLSLGEWYNRNAPNPTSIGSFFEIDGYEAMRVNNTVYIDAVNMEDDRIYKNVYILSHNQDAHISTLNIYDQLVNNFELNANWSVEDKGTNHCIGSPEIACSSDYDCPASDCDSRALKLKRDLIRLGDLFDIDKALYTYGANNMYCDNNPNIPFGSDCLGGAPWVPYYPRLSEGSYIPGLTTSKWPSWNNNNPNDLSYYLNTAISADPINEFNGCLDGYDFDTCWSTTDLEFYCQQDSLIYIYDVDDSGKNYRLGANFEYDDDPWTGESGFESFTFWNDLYTSGAEGVTAISDGNIVTNLTYMAHCTDNTISNPPGSIGDYCGDGVINGTELCDGTAGIINNACRVELAATSFGVQTWWNEQYAGCNPPGTPNECTPWQYLDEGGYTPEAFAALCGGFCGNDKLDNFYEQCDDTPAGTVYDDEYTCANPADLNCSPSCEARCGTELAPVCGDGILSSTEACDASANPNGLAAYDCTGGASPVCSDSCEIICSNTAQLPYVGLCGDGVSENLCLGPAPCPTYDGDKASCEAAAAASGCLWAEDCDYFGFEAPKPTTTVLGFPATGLSYACNTDCRYSGEFCGDGIEQYKYEELCDIAPGAYTRPSPDESNKFKQYQCRASVSSPFVDPVTLKEYFACTPTEGGYCGDGITQVGIELCDSDFPSPPIADSAPDNQYGCADTCMSYGGGWCGDRIVHDGQTDLARHGLSPFVNPANPDELPVAYPYGEACDEGIYDDPNFGVCSQDCQWMCFVGVDGKPSGNIGYADVRFGGDLVTEIGPGETVSMALPACRASGDLTFTMSVVGEIDIPDTAIIIITDKSGSMDSCAAGWSGGSYMSDACPDPSPVFSPVTYYGVNNDTITWDGASYSSPLPAEPDNIYQERMLAVQKALTDPGEALDTIRAKNQRADIALIAYSGSVEVTPFTPIEPQVDFDSLKSTINNYNAIGGTDHTLGLNAAYNLINASTTAYDNYIVIFMTDGECLGDCEDQAIGSMKNIQSLVTSAGKSFDSFSVLLNNPVPNPASTIDMDNLRGMMNAMTPYDCDYRILDPTGFNENVAPLAGSFCGDNNVDCINEEANIAKRFEECDDGGNANGDGCDENCKWEEPGNKRFYDYEFEGGNISDLYTSIANILPVDEIDVLIDGESFNIELATDTIDTEVRLDMSHLVDEGRCNEFSGNFFNFKANFAAETPETTVTLSNGRYEFCPWRNGDSSGQTYYTAAAAAPPTPPVCGGAGEACCTIAPICDDSSSLACDGSSCEPCGGLSQICCSGATCSGSLACITGQCMNPPASCGNNTEPCCDGTTCFAGLACNPTTTQCEGCGSTGDLCCPGDICNSGNICGSSGRCELCGGLNQSCCDSAPLCSSADTICNLVSGKCDSCGGVGEACCSSVPFCDPNAYCNLGSGSCVACGGIGQECCPGDTCTSGTCNTTTNQCVVCGDDGQLCCPGDSCNAGNNCSLAGSCVACGNNGDPCCDSGPLCVAGNYCNSGTCDLCGGIGQDCCPGDTCTTGTCDTVNNLCIACGGDSQDCCPGDTCDLGNSCHTVPNPSICLSGDLLICDHNGDGTRNINDQAIFDYCAATFDVDGDGARTINDAVLYGQNRHDDAWCANVFDCNCGDDGDACCASGTTCNAGNICFTGVNICRLGDTDVCDHNGDGTRDINDQNIFDNCASTYDVNGDGVHNILDMAAYYSNNHDDTWCAANWDCNCGYNGDLCCSGNTCIEAGLVCSLGICQNPAPGNLGEDCAPLPFQQCVNPLICDYDYPIAGRDTCQVGPGALMMSCGTGSDRCQGALTCYDPPLLCGEVAAAEGQPCATVPAGYPQCQTDLICEFGNCVIPPGNEGDPCGTGTLACNWPFTCDTDIASPTYDTCIAPVCYPVGAEGCTQFAVPGTSGSCCGEEYIPEQSAMCSSSGGPLTCVECQWKQNAPCGPDPGDGRCCSRPWASGAACSLGRCLYSDGTVNQRCSPDEFGVPTRCQAGLTCTFVLHPVFPSRGEDWWCL